MDVSTFKIWICSFVNYNLPNYPNLVVWIPVVWSCPKAEVEGQEEEANTTFLIYPEIPFSLFLQTDSAEWHLHFPYHPLHSTCKTERETARAIRAERIEVAVVEGGKEGGRGLPLTAGETLWGRRSFTGGKQRKEGSRHVVCSPLGSPVNFHLPALRGKAGEGAKATTLASYFNLHVQSSAK